MNTDLERALKKLGLRPGATAAQIRKAYRDMAKSFHPDRVGPESKLKFQEIQQAYETICRNIRAESPSGTPPARASRQAAEPIRDRRPPEPTRRRARSIGKPRAEPLSDTCGRFQSEPPHILLHAGTHPTDWSQPVVIEVPCRIARDSGWGALEIRQSTRKLVIQLPDRLESGSSFDLIDPDSGRIIARLTVVREKPSRIQEDTNEIG